MSDPKWFECHDARLHAFEPDEDSEDTYRSLCGEQYIDATTLRYGGGFYECPVDEVYNGCETCVEEVCDELAE